jgi:hypothetical protein
MIAAVAEPLDVLLFLHTAGLRGDVYRRTLAKIPWMRWLCYRVVAGGDA